MQTQCVWNKSQLAPCLIYIHIYLMQNTNAAVKQFFSNCVRTRTVPFGIFNYCAETLNEWLVDKWVHESVNLALQAYKLDYQLRCINAAHCFYFLLPIKENYKL